MSKDKPAEKKTETTKKAEKPAEPQVTYVTSTDLAKKLGIKPTILRRWLRTLPKFQDSGYTRYKWEEGDPFLADAEASYKKYQSQVEDKRAQREAEKLEKKAAKPAEGEKPAKGKKAKAVEAEPVEEEDAEGGEESDEGEELG